MLAEADLPKKKILIVDDEEDILEFLSYHFRRKGFDVTTQPDGLAALKNAREKHPDIIVSDIRMPHMDGIELCRQLKKDDALKNIPLLFLTADDGDCLALLAHQCGADSYLNKPVRIELIVNMVMDMVQAVQPN